jgi:hypothetical protein
MTLLAYTPRIFGHHRPSGRRSTRSARTLSTATAICLAVICFAGAAHAGDTVLTSTWRDRDITIDGSSTEWEDLLQYIQNSPNALAVCNDSDYLYMCFAIGDSLTERQVVTLGLTVWLDPRGGIDQSFGVHYPLGAATTAFHREDAPEAEDVGTYAATPTPQQRRTRMFEKMSTDMEIIGPDSGVVNKFPAPGAKDVSVAIGHTLSGTVYELKIPLRETIDHPYAVGVDSSIEIGFGLQVVPNADVMARMNSKPRTISGLVTGLGRRSGGSGGGMGRGHRPGGSRDSKRPQLFEYWDLIRLATGPPPPQKQN